MWASTCPPSPARINPALHFEIGDGGALYLTITPQDLRAGRFDRLCAEFQEG